MEVMHMNMRSHWGPRAYTTKRIAGGLVLLSIGTIFLLVNLGIFESRLFETWWPLLLIALGAAKLLGRGWYRPRKPYTDFGPA